MSAMWDKVDYDRIVVVASVQRNKAIEQVVKKNEEAKRREEEEESGRGKKGAVSRRP